MPPQGAHLWSWFWQLSRRRKTGPEALTFAEVGEWQRLTRTPVRPEEVELLMKMDDAFLAEIRKQQQEAAARASETME